MDQEHNSRHNQDSCLKRARMVNNSNSLIPRDFHNIHRASCLHRVEARGILNTLASLEDGNSRVNSREERTISNSMALVTHSFRVSHLRDSITHSFKVSHLRDS